MGYKETCLAFSNSELFAWLKKTNMFLSILMFHFYMHCLIGVVHEPSETHTTRFPYANVNDGFICKLFILETRNCVGKDSPIIHLVIFNDAKSRIKLNMPLRHSLVVLLLKNSYVQHHLEMIVWLCLVCSWCAYIYILLCLHGKLWIIIFSWPEK